MHIPMDNMEELEGGDFLAIVIWGLGVFFCVFTWIFMLSWIREPIAAVSR